MKNLKKLLLFVSVCLALLGATCALACAATKIPSETNPFVDNYYVDPINQSKPFFEKVFPEVIKNIKANNKHSISPYYDKFPKANNSQNFQGLGSTTYANINGKTVTAEAFYRVKNEALNDPNTGMGILIYQCIQYKLKHPNEKVKISFTSYRTSASAAVCVVPESKYYGYSRSLFGTNYDEHGFVRVAYMLTEAARMGIEVTLVHQLPSYGKKQYNPSTKKLKTRDEINYATYYNKALTSACYDKYAKGKKVSDFMKFAKVGWNVKNNGADMQHVKSASVSHYIDTKGKEHKNAIFLSSSNFDEIDYRGANGNNGSQSGVIISDHEALYRVLNNYTNLMYKYRAQEDLPLLRKQVAKMNEEQIKLIRAGKESQIPKDQQIVYLGSKTDPVFELYFTPFGGSHDTWDTTHNPYSKYVSKMEKSTGYVEFAWNLAYYSNCNFSKAMTDSLTKAYYNNRSVNNKIYLRTGGFDSAAIEKLTVGKDIGYRNIAISSSSTIHSKDILLSYVEGGVRHRVSLITSCNYGVGPFFYRTNSLLVINETDKTGGNFYRIMGQKYTDGMIHKTLKVNSPNLILGTGGSQTVSVEYLGKKKLTWSSSDKSVATVSSSGKIKAIKKGTATITVTDGTNKGTVKVTVAGCAGCMAASDGLSFNSGEHYMLSKALKANPLTFEAVFTVKKGSLSESTTTILGSDNRYDKCTVFAINKDGQPKVIIRDSAANTTGKTYTFNKVNVATGQKVHLAITMDLKNRKMYCYVNGKLAQTLSSIKKVSSYKDKHNMVIGGDLRNGNATYFTGTIASIALWSDIRSASEISNDYKKGISTSDKNLLVAHDFARCSSHRYTDKSSNKNDVKYVDLWLSKSQVKEVTDYEYSFAVIGDTQTMCEKDPDAMERIYDWILDNKESKKISYVIGLGDITDDSTDGEWETASRVIGKLNGKIPYVLTRGNHDDWDDFNRNLHNGFYETTVDGMMKSGDISLTDPSQPGLIKKVNADGSVTLVTREEDIPEGGTVKGDLTNSYRYFSIQGTNYLIMTLDFAPSSATLNWAGSVIKAHPNHKVIIVTHAYMYRDGTTLDAGDCYPPSYYDGYTDAQNGDQMWAKCFSKYENVVMVLSGHDPWQHIVYRQDEGVNGNTVTQMLIDAQYVDLTGSTGMVAMFYFSDGGETVTVRYYSVEKDCYGSEQSQFTVHLNHEYKNVNTKATFKKNGEKAVKCACGSKKSSKTIASVKSVTLSQTTFAYDGKKKTPSVTVKDSNGKKLKLNQDYTVKYSGGKAMGTYTVTVTLKGNYSGTKKLKFSIVPKTVSGLKATMTTSSITLNWSKVKGATAYEVYQYSAKKKKYVKVATVKKNSYKLSKLSAGTAYSFKVRAYYSKNKTKITGNFSSVLETATKTKAPEFTKVTSTAKGKVSFAWTDVSGESRYQIYYSTKKDGEYTKLTDFKANKKSGSKSKLTSGKTYYFKIRTYKKVGKSKVYSSYSAVKSVRVK